MALSRLQKYILTELAQIRTRQASRSRFRSYYHKYNASAHPAEIEATVTRSIERLIDRGLLIGYGRKTKEKLFIETVRLTRLGRLQAKKLLGEQQRLPLFSK